MSVRLVVTYDISKDKIRNRVFRILEGYGAWKQYSIFELEITDVQRVQMEEKIRGVIGPHDRVRVYELCTRCVGKITDLGEQSPESLSNVV
ncbi:CRISPR-associated endonuclease Cas2 [Methanofollis aquaemaris]|uniref:CRISPR-associated endonuclease Cas2 n=1 Tax=Methanofollis aquaemaris TaxID=126734 RepID=UPI00223EF303|nr:CRISPR-associated endonuclease Cas2 [Methanofollis aquaemaris]